MYNKCAQKYKLLESCLAIVHCANYEDNRLIQRLWVGIINNALKVSREYLENKIRDLGKELYPSAFFPLGMKKTYIQLIFRIYLWITWKNKFWKTRRAMGW